MKLPARCHCYRTLTAPVKCPPKSPTVEAKGHCRWRRAAAADRRTVLGDCLCRKAWPTAGCRCWWMATALPTSAAPLIMPVSPGDGPLTGGHRLQRVAVVRGGAVMGAPRHRPDHLVDNPGGGMVLLRLAPCLVPVTIRRQRSGRTRLVQAWWRSRLSRFLNGPPLHGHPSELRPALVP